MSRILLVDDEPIVLEVLQRLLEQPGREILTAPGPKEAQALAALHPIDVAVLDKNLIGASGLDLARQLRAQVPEMEVILLTGYASVDSAIEAVQLGAFDYLTKPIEDYAQLSRKVQLAEERCALRRGQRALLQQLMDSELRFRRLVESAPDALLLCDVQSGKLLDANPAAFRLYGWPPEEMARLAMAQICAVREAERARGPEPAFERHRKSDGTTFAAEVRTTEFSQDGRGVLALSIRDVSERERARSDRDRLEERLRVSQKMEAVGRLAGGVAHDFNNLLAVIQAHAEFLEHAIPETGSARPEVDGILRAAARGAALTRQLLLFSRHKPIEYARIEVNPVVAEVMRLLDRVIGEGIRLRGALEPALWPVKADADQLSQVVLNLAVNARDAMPSGGELRIRTSNFECTSRRALRVGELAPGRYVELAVSDDGAGMTPEVMARLFEPFFTTKEQGKGTGLGLATIYGIVQAAGGGVDVQSHPGMGSTFTVYLPATELGVEEAPARSLTLERGRGETILIVEDEEPLRAVVRRILVANGYEVLEGRNGREALHTSERHEGPIHLLVTDVVMPEMGGRELAEQLTRRRPDVRVLYMTGYTDRAVPESGARVALIQKPFQTQALLGHVRRLLDLS